MEKVISGQVSYDLAVIKLAQIRTRGGFYLVQKWLVEVVIFAKAEIILNHASDYDVAY